MSAKNQTVADGEVRWNVFSTRCGNTATETNLEAFLFLHRQEVFQLRAEEGQSCFMFAPLQVSNCHFIK